MKKLIQTAQDLQELENELMASKAIGFDIETTGLEAEHSDLVGASFAVVSKKLTENYPATYLPVGHSLSVISKKRNLPKDKVVSFIKRVLEKHPQIWIHNSKFEALHGLKYGWKVDFSRTRDSQIACWLCWVEPKLEKAMKELFDIERQSYKDLTKGKNMKEMTIDEVEAYGRFDASDTLRIGLFLTPKMQELGVEREFLDLEMPFTEVLVHMDSVGIKVNTDKLRSYSTDMTQLIGEVEAEVAAVLGEAPYLSSQNWLSSKMYDELKLWTPSGARGKNGYYSTKQELLEEIEHKEKNEKGRKVAELVLRFRGLEKIRSTYTESVANWVDSYADKRLRAGYNQTGTVTGRLSASTVHQMPRPSKGMPNLREAFIPEEGMTFVNADYSQIELRLVAHFSGDSRLVTAYQNGEDVHQQTADQCNCDRQFAKIINFGLIYGKWWGTLAFDLKCSEEEAKGYWQRYFEYYGGVKVLQDKMLDFVKKNGFVKTITGRYRFFPEVKVRKDLIPWMKRTWEAKEQSDFNAVKRMAINTRVQASAADLMKIAMRNLYKKWSSEGLIGQVKLVLQVHDELMVECPKDMAEKMSKDMKEEMEKVAKISVPLVVEPKIGNSWAECK